MLKESIIFLVHSLMLVLLGSNLSETAQRKYPVKQPREVIAAYRVCNEFQRLLAEDLDFSRAFEATFTKDQKRRREIAIAEGEFGDADVSRIEDATLIEAYKNRMQLVVLLLPLIGVEDDRSAPPEINAIFDRGNPRTTEEFLLFATQLKQDVATLRAHLKDLSEHNPAFAESLRKFQELLAKPIEVPTSYVVKPITYYSKGRVLRGDQPFYRIQEYSVIREGGEMKIIGVQFFTIRF